MTVEKSLPVGTIVKRITADNGNLYADIIARADCGYQAVAFHKDSNDARNWMSPAVSGIYANAEEAEEAALAIFKL